MEHLFENWRRYLTEEQLLKEEQVTQYIVESNIEHLWENNNYERLDEGVKDWLSTSAHVVLDVLGAAGDLVTPGAGAPFDAINMLWYLKKKCWLYAAFSAIALLPYIGDAIGKGGKILTYVKKGAKALQTLKGAIKKHQPKIDKVFDTMGTHEKSPELARDNAEQMRNALKIFSGDNSGAPPTC